MCNNKSAEVDVKVPPENSNYEILAKTTQFRGKNIKEHFDTEYV